MLERALSDCLECVRTVSPLSRNRASGASDTLGIALAQLRQCVCNFLCNFEKDVDTRLTTIVLYVTMSLGVGARSGGESLPPEPDIVQLGNSHLPTATVPTRHVLAYLVNFPRLKNPVEFNPQLPRVEGYG